MANLRTIQFLRSNTVYTGLTAAKDALSADTVVNKYTDGSPLLARYVENAGDTVIKTLLGIAHVGVGGTTGITFFETANEVAARLQALQDELDRSQVAVGLDSNGNKVNQTGAYIADKTTIEAEIKALNDVIEAMEYTKTVGDSEVFSKVSQVDGTISAETKNLTAVKLSGYTLGGDDSGKIAATDTLGEALGKLQGQINGMDLAAVSGEGDVITSVSEEDGKVSAFKTAIKDVKLNGYTKDTSKTGAIDGTDDVEDALSKIENAITANKIANADGSINVTTNASGTDINVNIKSDDHVLAKDGNEGLYTNIAISAVTGTELTNLGTLVKEAYKLVGTDDTKLGEYIKIYKDSSISKIYLGYPTDTVDAGTGVITSGTTGEAQSLNYVYHKEDSTYEMVHVDVSKFLAESEFASGVTADSNGVVHGVVDSTSEKVITAYSTSGENTEADVLSVGTDGFKVSNIQAAINAAVGKATTEVTLTHDTQSGVSVAENAHVTLSSATADNGKVTYTIHTNDIASKNDLDVEIARAKSAEAAFDNVIGTTKDAEGEARTYTKTGTHYVTSGPTVLADITTLDDKLFEASGKTVTAVEMTGGTAAITAHTDGTKKITINTDGSQILATNFNASATSGVPAATDSVSVVLSKLYANANMNAVKAGSATTVVAAADGTTVDVKLDTTSAKSTWNGDNISGDTGTNALTITSDGLFLSRDWDCGTF